MRDVHGWGLTNEDIVLLREGCLVYLFFAKIALDLITNNITTHPRRNGKYKRTSKHRKHTRGTGTRLTAAAAAPPPGRRNLVSCGLQRGREVAILGLFVPARECTCRTSGRCNAAEVTITGDRDGGRSWAGQPPHTRRHRHLAPIQAPWLHIDGGAPADAAAKPEHKSHLGVITAAATTTIGIKAPRSSTNRPRRSHQRRIPSTFIHPHPHRSQRQRRRTEET